MSPLLDLTLTANRSLSMRHTRWLVGLVGGIFLLGGLRFLALGAWPILPFMVADVALLGWAFRASHTAGGGHERVLLTGDALTLTRVTPQGQEKRFGFEPLWTRVQVDETPLGDALVYLAARDRRVSVGRFLSAPERRQVAEAISAALSAYRGRSGAALAP